MLAAPPPGRVRRADLALGARVRPPVALGVQLGALARSPRARRRVPCGRPTSLATTVDAASAVGFAFGLGFRFGFRVESRLGFAFGVGGAREVFGGFRAERDDFSADGSVSTTTPSMAAPFATGGEEAIAMDLSWSSSVTNSPAYARGAEGGKGSPPKGSLAGGRVGLDGGARAPELGSSGHRATRGEGRVRGRLRRAAKTLAGSRRHTEEGLRTLLQLAG